MARLPLGSEVGENDALFRGKMAPQDAVGWLNMVKCSLSGSDGDKGRE